ncbi:PREDICTED: uncharacterized protein LOC109584997 [Amphimedon queenslandica]|uniref:Uncharacterized protein n=1 Tax=Amphimedon queenslandica TaxID=400682 RepID=A0AAN0JIH2_AMPQE|nr:PREDICTED: uncharacterized protein LOC109584997 [Amphimedon queenslandica]|eukprot:XP_019856473.1 PREDICTED: uncharacterized protein LOC109584997 [Amphimedon queenslandica]
MRTRNSLSFSSAGGNDALPQDPVSQQQESASTGSIPKEILKAVTYAGLIYYEEKGVEDQVTFTTAKNLNALVEYIERKHSEAEMGPHKYFRIASPDGFIELKFGTRQKKSCKGWTIEPHIEPCRLHQRNIYNFGDKDYSLPPSCLISIYSSPNAVPTLHYSVPVEGVADPVSFYIHRSRRTAHPIAAAPSSSGSNETTPTPTKRRREGGFDIKTAKQKIKQVMNENYSSFAKILESSLKEIANKLFEAKIIAEQVQKSPTYDAIASSFLAMMDLFDSKSDLEKHCMKYLEALSSVGGPIEFAANLLREKWTTALEGTLQFEQSVKRVRTKR